ncbi:MAG: hypothetical protein LBU60_00770 [Clostridiales bacterium]|jgi:predicted RNA-binding protein Jag|nr:hypothetical protein [Clostridiales bacterium]
MIEIQKISNDLGHAINEALKDLDATFSQVDIQVLKYGLFKRTKIKVALNSDELKKRGLGNAVSRQSLDNENLEQSSTKTIEQSGVSNTAVQQSKVKGSFKPQNSAISVQSHHKNSQLNIQKNSPLSAQNQQNNLSKATSQTSSNTSKDIDKSQNSKPINTKKPNSFLNTAKTAPNVALNTVKTVLNGNDTVHRKLQDEAKIKTLQDQVVASFLPVQSGASVENSVSKFIQTILVNMGLVDVKVICYENVSDKSLYVELDTADKAVIGFKGEVLDALEFLANLFVNKGDYGFSKVCLDSQKFQAKRLQNIRQLANKTADKVVRIGKKVKMEPMSDATRKFVHSLLSHDNRVFAKSEGSGNNRCIVVFPAR